MRCFALLWLIFLFLCLPARPESPGARLDSLAARIAQARALKDSLLRYGSDSPLPPQARSGFAGLNYFPMDPEFRLIGDLHIYGRRQQISVPTTAGTALPVERFGRLQIHPQGKPFWLEVYRGIESGELMVFFKDSTNGLETYAGGRYVPLAEVGDGQYLLDFNLSYNPYCAYNPEYICPLPPPQNHLPVPIRAGEKIPGLDLAH